MSRNLTTWFQSKRFALNPFTLSENTTNSHTYHQTCIWNSTLRNRKSSLIICFQISDSITREDKSPFSHTCQESKLSTLYRSTPRTFCHWPLTKTESQLRLIRNWWRPWSKLRGKISTPKSESLLNSQRLGTWARTNQKIMSFASRWPMWLNSRISPQCTRFRKSKMHTISVSTNKTGSEALTNTFILIKLSHNTSSVNSSKKFFLRNFLNTIVPTNPLLFKTCTKSLVKPLTKKS